MMYGNRGGALEAEVALSMIPRINASVMRHLEEEGIGAEDFFSMSVEDAGHAGGLSGSMRLTESMRDEALYRAREEIRFMQAHHIRFLLFGGEGYPPLLCEAEDAPVGLYILGEADLEAKEIMGMVGTRKSTPNGAAFIKKFVADIAAYFPECVIVSGLAFGIDSMSHEAAMENGLPTVAVVAHGLEMIYPAANRDLARRIIGKGGAIISEYSRGTRIHRSNFLQRNRIIAGLTPLTIVVESDLKGGAMSTAACAFSYNREVMAVPGRISDTASAGCNHLIRRHKASLLTAAPDVIEQMGWRPGNIRLSGVQQKLFPEIEGDAGVVYDCMRYCGNDPVNVDYVVEKTGLTTARVLAALSDLEFDGILLRYPGGRYALC